MRQTITGIATPFSLIALRLRFPLDPATETPVVLTLKAQKSLILRGVTPEQIVIENISDRVIPYLVVIMPRNALMLRSDWKQKLAAIVQQLLSPPTPPAASP